ncbi:hypothetical protein CU102_21270 [Phyllobacterium brassicacearum]|uniref:Uncharacterized protein n=1 Tax=Phyllobacterium brassicacearum TaxID=314235 RepID=A0A2P7BE77_9HYPH|nr:hypothetical protein CU102_21270 [Phyllobacterium brassicacearum]
MSNAIEPSCIPRKRVGTACHDSIAPAALPRERDGCGCSIKDGGGVRSLVLGERLYNIESYGQTVV